MEKMNILELPTKLMEMSAENTKKSMDLTMNYLQSLDKMQRDLIKQTYELLNQTWPGEAKIWEFQTNMLQKGFDLLDKTYEKFVPAGK